MVEVTCRTIQGRYLLRPDPVVDATILGVLARALRPHPTVGLVNIAILSNHLHMLLRVETQHQLSKIMEYFGGHCTRKLNPLLDWSGPLWDGRYQAICISDEPEAQIERFEYVLAQGVKENLVEKVADWPGVHGGKALLEGRSLLAGKWIDGTKKYQASLRGADSNPQDFTSVETLELELLPCWEHLSWSDYAERVREIVDRIEARAAEERQLKGTRVLGAEAICRRHPHERPPKLETSPAPLVHAATRQVRRAWKEAYSWFLERYREASRRLRNGEDGAFFPEGCYPPRLPFVGAGAGGIPRLPAMA